MSYLVAFGAVGGAGAVFTKAVTNHIHVSMGVVGAHLLHLSHAHPVWPDCGGGSLERSLCARILSPG